MTMQHISATPFGRRALSAGLLASQSLAAAPVVMPSVDKWHLFADLRDARAQFGVSDRDLAVLNALLSFHPARLLEDDGELIVFPSNATLSDRAHGMPESTLRRHLAALVSAGLIARHDSPNGKRYVTRMEGNILRAFGFSLRPLLVRAAEIVSAAADHRQAALTLRLTRERLVVALRDCTKLLAFAEADVNNAELQAVSSHMAALRNMLRRKLTIVETEGLLSAVEELRARLMTVAQQVFETPVLSGNDSHFERHSQDSKPDLKESEFSAEAVEMVQDETGENTHAQLPPLSLVLKACPDVVPYADADLRDWHGLLCAAHRLHPLMGVGAEVWRDAVRVMGAETAAVTLAAMLQRITQIQRPGAYLRQLTAKAARGEFSCGPMIMALLSTRGGAAWS